MHVLTAKLREERAARRTTVSDLETNSPPLTANSSGSAASCNSTASPSASAASGNARPTALSGTVVVVLAWINGPSGGGKTATAFELQRRLAGSIVCDPEHLGFGLHRMLPPPCARIFSTCQRGGPACARSWT